MINNLEFILKIVFIILTIIWIGKILILRTDKQIVINPLLIGISALLVVIPSCRDNVLFFGISIEYIRIALYCIYSVIVLFGIYTTSRKNDIF